MVSCDWWNSILIITQEAAPSADGCSTVLRCYISRTLASNLHEFRFCCLIAIDVVGSVNKLYLVTQKKMPGFMRVLRNDTKVWVRACRSTHVMFLTLILSVHRYMYFCFPVVLYFTHSKSVLNYTILFRLVASGL